MGGRLQKKPLKASCSSVRSSWCALRGHCVGLVRALHGPCVAVGGVFVTHHAHGSFLHQNRNKVPVGVVGLVVEGKSG